MRHSYQRVEHFESADRVDADAAAFEQNQDCYDAWLAASQPVPRVRSEVDWLTRCEEAVFGLWPQDWAFVRELAPPLGVLSLFVTAAITLLLNPTGFREPPSELLAQLDGGELVVAKSLPFGAAELAPAEPAEPTPRLVSWFEPRLTLTLTHHIKRDQTQIAARASAHNTPFDNPMRGIIRIVDLPETIEIEGGHRVDQRTWQSGQNVPGNIRMILGADVPSNFAYGVQIFDDSGGLVGLFETRVTVEEPVSVAQSVVAATVTAALVPAAIVFEPVVLEPVVLAPIVPAAAVPARVPTPPPSAAEPVKLPMPRTIVPSLPAPAALAMANPWPAATVMKSAAVESFKANSKPEPRMPVARAPAAFVVVRPRAPVEPEFKPVRRPEPVKAAPVLVEKTPIVPERKSTLGGPAKLAVPTVPKPSAPMQLKPVPVKPKGSVRPEWVSTIDLYGRP